jgi:iron complex outermembrane recepter protein
LDRWGRLCSVACLGIGLALQARADEALVQFDIPAAEARTGLNLFARQSGTPMLYMNEPLGSRRTNAVSGKLTVRQALEILLRHTGISGVINKAGVLTITVGDPENSAQPGEIKMQENEKPAKRGAAFLAAVVALLTAGFAAHADDTPQTYAGGNSAALEEIIVTAQKRVENLQNVPVSVQVISGQKLADENYNSLADLTQTVPSVHVLTGPFDNQLYIRGIGSGQNASFDQSVATFVDDIYHGRSRMSNATFLDLDRIEVLKGPQSTFFGNNAIAGALNIVTKKPGDTFDASARALYGQFGQYALEGAVGGPITDILGARLAVTRNGDDRGWIENVSLGQRAPINNNEAGRLTLVFNPSQDLDATFKIEGSKSRLSGSYADEPVQWNNCPPPPPFGPGAVLGCANALALIAAGKYIPLGLDNNLNTGLPGQGNTLSTFEDVLTTNYRQWGQTFTSVTGFNNYHSNTDVDNGLLPVDVIATSQSPEKYHQFSQELRVASAVDQTVAYLAGVYFQTDQLNYAQQATLPLFDGLPADGFPFDQLAPYLPIASLGGFSQREDVYSAFGSLSWTATDKLKISGGLRASWVSKNSTIYKSYGTGTELYGGFEPLPAAIQPTAGLLLGAPGSEEFEQTNHAVMPSARFQYEFSSEAMGYFSYNRGFKAGGFNGDVAFAPIANSAYGPEYVNAYELGIKTTWLDNTVLLDVDVFRSDYKGLQVSASTHDVATDTFTTYVQNAASSTSEGVEIEARWAVTQALRLSTNITYLDSHYDSYPNAPQTLLQSTCAALSAATPQCAQFVYPIASVENLSGTPTQFAPRWSGSMTASYVLQLPGEYQFTTEVSPYFTSSYNKDPQFDLAGIGYAAGSDAYYRLDARLTLTGPGGHWAVDVIGKNLADRLIIVNNGFGTGWKEEPRNVAVQFRYHY